MKLNSASVVLAALLALLPGTLPSFGAEPQTSSQGANSEDVYKKVWKFAEWYKNDQNPIVQNLLFSGRFQYEYAAIDSDQGNHHERKLLEHGTVSLRQGVGFGGRRDLPSLAWPLVFV